MSQPPPPDCRSCDAVCCLLTVVLQPGDDVPERFTTHTPGGQRVMDQDEEGWCVAIDPARMCCSIYDTRPRVCRDFAMAGKECRRVRKDYSERRGRSIPLAMY